MCVQAAGNAIPSIASGLLEDISGLEGDDASAKETASKNTMTLIYSGEQITHIHVMRLELKIYVYNQVELIL